MKVFVNEKEFTLFNGAKVIDALRMYNNKAIKEIEQGLAEILDAYGNHTDLNGAIHEGSRLFFRKIKK